MNISFIKDLVRTLVSRLLLVIFILIFFIPIVIFLLIPVSWRLDNPLLFRLQHFFYWVVLKGSFLPITIIGKENIPQTPAIIVANHQSSLDIPLVGSLVSGYPHVWLATTGLLKSPILRHVLPRITVLIDMSTPSKGMRSLIKAVNMVYSKPRHTMIFPEGGRFTDGKIHDFYGGFVILAKKTGRPVVPVCIVDAYKAYPPGRFLIEYHPITVIVGPEFRQQEDESDVAFKERVRQWFCEQHGA